MDGDCGSWPRPDGQAPDFNSSGVWTRDYSGLQDQLSTSMYPWHDPIATNQGFAVPSLAKPSQTYFDHAEPHGWFHCLPTFGQEMFPPSNSVLNEHLSVESHAASKSHNASQQFYQKQFLVFDQTGDQRTMIYSSGVGTPPAHCLSHWKEKQVAASIFRPQPEGSNMVGHADTFLMNNFIEKSEFDVDNESDLQSEMHEDTEELNALMYSDEDTYEDYDEDKDEVTSTGHSPSTLPVHDKLNGLAGIGEDVASSDEEPTKRQKIFNAWNAIAKNDFRITQSHSTFCVDDDTESRCGSLKMHDSGKNISLSGKKRDRKDSIRETVRTLQSMIPCGKGTTPIEVIDEAINFLLSLKLKANSLGFDSTN